MTFKEKLANTDRRLTAHICTIPSPVVIQAMVAAGTDAVIIDMEHGAIDYGSAQAMIGATARSDCAPLVRIAAIEDWQVKRVLDLGAEGIVFPLVRTAADAERAVASLTYPPSGSRGFGPFIAHSHEGTGLLDYRTEIDGTRSCVLLVETRDAVENIDEICAVDGIDLLVPALFDLSTDLGVSGQFDHPDVVAALRRIEDAAKSAGIPLGNAALNKDQAEGLFARGYRVIAGFDALWVGATAREVQSWTT